MIKERSEHTNKIIEELKKLPEGEKISRLKLADIAGVRTGNVNGFIATARRYLASNYKIYFRQITKVGLQRNVPGDNTAIYTDGYKKVERAVVRNSKQLGDEQVDRLTPQQLEEYTVKSVIDSSLRNSISTRELIKNVEIAKIDGAKRVLAAIESIRAREGK